MRTTPVLGIAAASAQAELVAAKQQLPSGVDHQDDGSGGGGLRGPLGLGSSSDSSSARPRSSDHKDLNAAPANANGSYVNQGRDNASTYTGAGSGNARYVGGNGSGGDAVTMPGGTGATAGTSDGGSQPGNNVNPSTVTVGKTTYNIGSTPNGQQAGTAGYAGGSSTSSGQTGNSAGGANSGSNNHR